MTQEPNSNSANDSLHRIVRYVPKHANVTYYLSRYIFSIIYYHSPLSERKWRSRMIEFCGLSLPL